jgi:aldose 1-epimerase
MAMAIIREDFGVTAGQEQVTKYTLTNQNGMKVSFIDFGAVITNIWVPDKNGVFEDIALGFDSIEGYENNKPAFGAVVGRVANRISNGSFCLNGKTYQLEQNDKTNCLHGGTNRYEKCMYQAECE